MSSRNDKKEDAISDASVSQTHSANKASWVHGIWEPFYAFHARVDEPLKTIASPYKSVASIVAGIGIIITAAIGIVAIFSKSDSGPEPSAESRPPIVATIKGGDTPHITPGPPRRMRIKFDRTIPLNGNELSRLKSQADAGDVRAQVEISDRALRRNQFAVISQQISFPDIHYYIRSAADANDPEANLLYGEALLGKIPLYNDFSRPSPREGLEYIEKAASQGEPAAMNTIGDAYWFGIYNVEQSYSNALEEFRNAEDKDESGYSSYKIGQAYEYGLGVRRNPAAAFMQYEKAAAKNNVYGINDVIRCYYEGIGIKQNLPEAFRRCVDATKNPANAWAFYMAGWFYDLGHGIEQNAEAAFNLYKQSAEKDFFPAKMKLADFYYFGREVERNYEEAYRLYSEAEQNDNGGYAACMLGRCYEFGHGVGQHLELARLYYQESALKGYGYGMLEFARCNYGAIGGERDDSEAFEMWELLLERDGSGCASVILGSYYEFGNGVEKNYKKAFEYYALSAKKENFYGEIMLALCYHNGIGVEKDEKRALELIQDAALKDYTGMLFAEFGRAYEYGDGVEQDFLKAFEYYKMSAEKGNIDGKIKLAYCYYYGLGVEKDFKRAFALMNSVAPDDRSGWAFFEMGVSYEYGDGVEQDSQKAFEYYFLSAKKGNIEGQLALAACYHNGFGVEQDAKQAFALVRAIAQEDVTGRAFFWMGVSYEYGDGVEQDSREAFRYYFLSTQKGNIDGQLNFAGCYYNGFGVEQSAKQGFALVRAIAQEDVTGWAFYTMGRSYEYGSGVEQDSQKAFRHYFLSAKKGNIDGQLALANCYYNGFGVEQSTRQGFALMRAVAQEDATGWAFYTMGRSYEYGDGIEKNTLEAFKNYKLSAEKGDIDGKFNLAACYYHGIGVEQNFHEAFAKYKEIEEEDETGHALRMLGLCYELGDGVEKDMDKAAEYYKRADDMLSASEE